MAGNTMTLNFAGDATKLQRAAAQAVAATDATGDAARRAGQAYDDSAKQADKFTQRMGSLGAATSGATDAVDSLAGGAQALADTMDFQRSQAAKLARANQDVSQAYQDIRQSARDANQALINGKTAVLDEKEAKLDQKDALKEYNKAVKEHGKGSDEAARAQIALQRAGLAVEQAQEDGKQAVEDGKQAAEDAKTAQLDLNDAQKEANPSGLQKFADVAGVLSPLLSGLVAVISLATAAQWLWNTALLANPLTWIVLAIVAVVAGIVLLWKNSETFRNFWIATWNLIKGAASAVGSWFKDTLAPAIGRAWDWIKSKATALWDWLKAFPGRLKTSFVQLVSIISQPFRQAFNLISDYWNNTVGQLSWTVPDFVPFIGGNSVRAPRLPKFHTGGIVPGSPGQEVPIMAMAGERVSRPGSGGGDTLQVQVMLGREVLIEGIAKEVRRLGGNVQFVLGGANA